MKIGLLHQYRLASSGSGLYATKVVERLLARGHDLFVFSHDERPGEISSSLAAAAAGGGANPSPGRCRTYSLREGRLAVAYPRAEEPDAVTFAGLSDAELEDYVEHRVERIVAIAKDVGLDVLHANHEVPSAYIALRVFEQIGLPYVVVAHGSTIEYIHKREPRYRPLTEAGLSGAHAVVALNADVRDRLLDIAADIEPAVVTVPVGVDLDLFHPPDPGPTSGSRQVVAYVGRLSLEKGVHALLAAFVEIARRAPEVHLLVMGDGVARPHLQRLVHALDSGDLDGAEAALRSAAGPEDAEWAEPVLRYWQQVGTATDCGTRTAGNLESRITFTGPLPPAEIARRLREVDVLVVPSLVREAFPLVTLEALASGVPPIAPGIGGLAAVMEEIQGQLGPLGRLLRIDADPDRFVPHLATGVGALLEHLALPSNRDDARRLCRETAVETYGWDVVVGRLEALYRGAAEAVSPALAP